MLDLLIEVVTIDGGNRVTLTPAILADAELVPIAEPEPSYWIPNPHQMLSYSWEVSLPPRAG